MKPLPWKELPPPAPHDALLVLLEETLTNICVCLRHFDPPDPPGEKGTLVNLFKRAADPPDKRQAGRFLSGQGS